MPEGVVEEEQEKDKTPEVPDLMQDVLAFIKESKKILYGLLYVRKAADKIK